MEWWAAVIGLMQRRQVVVTAILVAVALGAMTYLITPMRYASSTTMVLTTTEFGGTESRDPTRPTDLTNPMLNFNDSLKTTSAILIEAMNAKDVDAELGARGSTRLVVDDGRTNPNLLGLNGPFLYIAARSTSPERAEQVVRRAQELMREKLRTWQSSLNAPEKTYVSLADVVPPTPPAPDRARSMRFALVAFIGGFVISIGIAYLRLRLRPRWRRPATVADAEPPIVVSAALTAGSARDR